MKKVPSTIVKKCSRELTSVFESFNPYQGMEGRVERIRITEIATDGIHLVGHTKGYIQVLVDAPQSMLGTSTDVKITSVGGWSVFGKVIGTLLPVKEDIRQRNFAVETSPTPDSCNCMCSRQPEPCSVTSQNCGQGCCMGNEVPDSIIIDSSKAGNWRSRTLVNSIRSLLLRKRMQGYEKSNNERKLQSSDKQERTKGRLGTLGWMLICGMLTSFMIIV